MNKNKSGFLADRPLRVAVIGMGGFATRHHAVLLDLERQDYCQVIATCDPAPEKFKKLEGELNFTARGIAVYTDYIEMLDAHREELDFVCVPSPIPLHAAMHRACVERGLACYLEKPPTLFWEELEEMLRVEETALHQTQVGFAYIVEEPRQELKRRLVRGDFGRLRRVGFAGQLPRNTAYFNRTPWSGRVQMNNRPVLDSCIGNAMSHFIHNLLYWCGQDSMAAWNEVETIEAELYRAHNIENFDTCFARGICRNGVEIGIAATHTGEPPGGQQEWLECENATIRYINGETIRYSIKWRDGHDESVSVIPVELLTANIQGYMKYLRGEVARPSTRLIDSRPFVHLSNLLYVAAGTIHTIDDAYLTKLPANQNESQWVVVDGMQHAMKEFIDSRRMPGETNSPWGRLGGHASIDQLASLSDVIKRIGVFSGV
jgi:predicted dehydrogenase